VDSDKKERTPIAPTRRDDRVGRLDLATGSVVLSSSKHERIQKDRKGDTRKEDHETKKSDRYIERTVLQKREDVDLIEVKDGREQAGAAGRKNVEFHFSATKRP